MKIIKTLLLCVALFGITACSSTYSLEEGKYITSQSNEGYKKKTIKKKTDLSQFRKLLYFETNMVNSEYRAKFLERLRNIKFFQRVHDDRYIDTSVYEETNIYPVKDKNIRKAYLDAQYSDYLILEVIVKKTGSYEYEINMTAKTNKSDDLLFVYKDKQKLFVTTINDALFNKSLNTFSDWVTSLEHGSI